METEPQAEYDVSRRVPIEVTRSEPIPIVKQELNEPSSKEKQEEREPNYQATMQNLQQQANLQVVSQNVKTELQNQVQVHEQVWKPVLNNRTHQRLESVYHKISPEGVIYFDVLDQNEFISQTKKNFQTLIQNHQVETIKSERWDSEEIEKMFGKGLNPTSLITSYESAQWFTKEAPLPNDSVILELGTGAGWATVMLYESIKKQYPEAKLKQYSVDMSPHAIAATQTLLTYRNIPHIVATNHKEFEQIQSWMSNTSEGKDFSGVVLVLDNINEVLNRFSEKSINGVYSSHGTAYLSKSEYTNFLKTLSYKLKKDGIFIADSLNPLYTNQLDTGTTLSQMIAPKRVRESLTKRGITYIYGEKIKNNSKYFPGEDVQVLKGFNTSQAYLILEWCNYLLRRMDFSRLIKTVKSLQVTMKVVDNYRADVFPSFLLKNIVSDENLKFESLNNPPEFPIFMDTQGFRVKE